MSYISAELSKDRSHVLLWRRLNNKRVLEKIPTPLYFYIENSRGEYESIFGKKLSKYEFTDYKSFYQTRQDLIDKKITLYESDIRPEYKILSSFYNKESVTPNITFYDIEVDYDPKNGGTENAKPSNPLAPISAISIYHKHSDKSIVYVVPPKTNWDRDEVEKLNDLCPVIICENERELLEYFLQEIEDTDILSGWNSMSYDDPYIYERLKRVISPFAANKLSFSQGKEPYYKEIMNKFKIPQNKLITSGRVMLDYMELFIKFQQGNRDSYALDAIAEEELEIRKISFDVSLHSLYNNNFHIFVLYSIRDTEILKGLEDKFGYMSLAVNMAHLNTCQIVDVLGTTKQTEMAIINQSHYEMNRIVPDSKEAVHTEDKFKGAFVVPTTPGLYEWIGTIDVTSLYPSTMRSLNLSPETIIGQFYDKHLAFNEILEMSDKELTILYENEMSETKTAKEWKEYLIESGWAVTAAGTVIDQTIQGIIPSILTKWFIDRQKYKAEVVRLEGMIKNSKDSLEIKEHDEKRKFYDRLQNIKKLSLNSLYGACGNPFFKFFDIRLAESTTRSGERVLRHMLKTVGEKMENSYEFPNNYIIAGDTDSAMFRTDADNLDDALVVGKIIQKAVNLSVPKFLQNEFCIIEKNCHNISVEFENVGKRAIFVKQKNYLINLAYKDGKIVDTFKIQGVQIKKTNLPKYIRHDLTEFMKRFLRGTSWKELALDIVNYRDSVILKKDILELGMPIQIKKLEDYYEKYLSRNKNESLTVLRLPGHVRASILWNELLKKYNDVENLPITSGMKIKKFNLKNEINGIKSIAVPTDLKIVPQWFVDNIIPLIDKERQVVGLIDKPIMQILPAINEVLPTKQLLLIDEEFV